MILGCTTQNAPPLLKKPILTSKEYETALEEEEQTLDLLYDFYALDAWLNHPVKRFKPDSKEHQRNLRWTNNNGKNCDLYSMFAQNTETTGAGTTLLNESKNVGGGVGGGGGGVQQGFAKQEIKMEAGCPVSAQTASGLFFRTHLVETIDCRQINKWFDILVNNKNKRSMTKK